MDQVEAPSLHFLLELVPSNINVFVVQFDPKGVCRTDKHHSADQHASPYSKVGDKLGLYWFVLIDVEE